MPKHVFISAKSDDYTQATEIHSYLNSQGIAVFFAPQSLPQLESSDYRKKIDEALDCAEHMIVVASSKANVESSWVEAEWGFFVNELRSGRKHGNLMTVLVGNMKIDDLPPALRGFEVIPFATDAFPRLLPCVRSAERLPPVEQQQDVDRRVLDVHLRCAEPIPDRAAALTELNTAIDEYENLRGREDAWSPTHKYDRVGFDEPDTLSQRQWLADLRHRIAAALTLRGNLKSKIVGQGQQAARADFDAAISLLEQLEYEYPFPNITLGEVMFLIQVRGSLRENYAYAAECIDDASAALRYCDKAVQITEQLYNAKLADVDVDTNMFSMILAGRGQIKEKLQDWRGASADYARSLQSLQRFHQLVPGLSSVSDRIRALQSRQAYVQQQIAASGGQSWLKKLFG